ncbi:hypothetical protein LQG66_17655 [Bradyrhizobium ontarionense]|uniref:Uncharacterized protein n=1 Tax=Bradyrhizobium ontarionense TaxID=2898149 RepID=A0ABY3RMB8_9BRAD|nr:hypothetical protein [Bradyrhizobium sp. A19]UFZ08007.1 hypothetical protein LQG66_17655 [Bradyrhizobium sp. A19]
MQSAKMTAGRETVLRKAKLLVDVSHENRLVMTILQYARSGHATDLMVEQAIALVNGQVSAAQEEGDDGWLRSALELKFELEKALKLSVKSLRQTQGGW